MIGLFLMTKKGIDILLSINKNNLLDTICFVCSSEDTQIENDYFTEIQTFCNTHKIVFFERKNSPNLPDSKYRIAVGWRWIIPNNENLIVIHDALLPKYRGFAPLVNALINGENQIGTTALWASDDYDKGNIIYQEKIHISYPIKIKNAIDLISFTYCELVNKIIKCIKDNNQLPSTPQNEADASYSLWRDDNDYEVDWNQSSKKIKNFIDAVGYPYRGAIISSIKEKYRIFDCEIVKDVKIENRHIGKIIFIDKCGDPVVVCKKGLLKLTDIRNDKGEAIKIKKFRTKFL